MFKVEVNKKLIQWYLDNHMFKPDVSFCGRAKKILDEKYDRPVQFSSEISKAVDFLKERKQILEDKINSEKSQEIVAKIQDFFKIDNSKKIFIKIFLLVHIGEGTGGTFCKGNPSFMFLRVSPDKKFSIHVIWHEYMHHMASLSVHFKMKRDEITQKITVPDSINIGIQSIIEEGVVYVAESLIIQRKIEQSDIDIEKLGKFRAWGAFRRQTLNIRKYSNLDDIFDSIPEDWENFTKGYLT